MDVSIENISYPCLVIDIGTSRIPKSFESETVEKTIGDIKIFECAYCYLESPDTEIDERNIFYFEIQNDLSILKQFVKQIEPLLRKCTVVAHNVDTDIKLLRGMFHLVGFSDFALNVNKFCTMKYGRKYSKTHIWSGGKKVKKYPHLQELYRNLTGEDIGKGSIIDDVYQCFTCFKIMEAISGQQVCD